MNRSIIVAATMLACAALPCLTSVGAQGAPATCAPLAVATSTELRVLRYWLASDDSSKAEWRASLGLTKSYSDSIIRVADAAVCDRASYAADSIAERLGRHLDTRVYQLDPYYVISDPSDDWDERHLMYVVDSTFALKSTIGY